MCADRLNSIWIKMLPYVEYVLKVRGEYDQDLVSDTYLELYDGRQNIQQDASNHRVAWYAVSTAENLIIQRPGRYNRVREVAYNDNRRYHDRSLTDSDKKHIENMMDVVMNAFEAIKKNGRTDYRYKNERRRVLELYLQGYTFTEIARVMKKNQSHEAYRYVMEHDTRYSEAVGFAYIRCEQKFGHTYAPRTSVQEQLFGAMRVTCFVVWRWYKYIK